MYLITQMNKLNKLNSKPLINIIYEWQTTGKRVLFRPGAAPTVGHNYSNSFADELKVETNYYLFDCGGSRAAEPEDRPCKTIVVSSPDSNHYKSWLKMKRCAFFMSEWAAEEITAAVDLQIFTQHTRDVYLRRFDYYGGVARSVFDPILSAVSADDLQAEITSMLKKVNLRDCLVRLQSSNLISMDFPKSGSSLLKFVVPSTAPFTRDRISVNWLSEKIEQTFHLLSAEAGGTELMNFLFFTAGVKEFTDMRQRSFENYVLEKLPLGGTYSLRRLHRKELKMKKSLEEVEFKQTEPKHFTVDKFSQLKPGQFGIPLALNQPVIDAIALPNSLFQVTISRSHGINEKKLNELVNMMCANDPTISDINYYVVVPQDIFRVYSAVEVAVQLTNTAINFHQFVLFMPLQPGAKPSPFIDSESAGDSDDAQLPPLSLVSAPAPPAVGDEPALAASAAAEDEPAAKRFKPATEG